MKPSEVQDNLASEVVSWTLWTQVALVIQTIANRPGKQRAIALMQVFHSCVPVPASPRLCGDVAYLGRALRASLMRSVPVSAGRGPSGQDRKGGV